MRAPITLASVLLGLFAPATVGAQVLAEPTLTGRALLSDTVLTAGTVVLHHVSSDTQGSLDSTVVRPDGSFTFRLPTVPDPDRSDVYFASVRHQGILYFGPAVTLAIQLDSVYEIRTYDTAMVPEGGASLPVQARNVFLEEEGGLWRVTDLFQLRNDRGRTLVAEDDGLVWRHPLAEGVTDPELAQTGFALDAGEFQGEDVVIRAPIPPGERMVVVRYTVPDPFLVLPMPVGAEVLEILVKEPAPPLEAPGLSPMERVELEPGSSYRRFTASEVEARTLRLVQGTEVRPPPVEWMAVFLSLLLAGAGLWAVGQGGASGRTTPSPPQTRAQLILEVARLDETFEALANPSAEEQGVYQARRRELLRRLRTSR